MKCLFIFDAECWAAWRPSSPKGKMPITAFARAWTHTTTWKWRPPSLQQPVSHPTPSMSQKIHTLVWKVVHIEQYCVCHFYALLHIMLLLIAVIINTNEKRMRSNVWWTVCTVSPLQLFWFGCIIHNCFVFFRDFAAGICNKISEMIQGKKKISLWIFSRILNVFILLRSISLCVFKITLL